MNILIAEDDNTSRLLLKTVLERNGHEVIACTDGRSALEAIEEPMAPRLAILDWMMPELDGTEVIRSIRSRAATKEMYLILLTAKDQRKDIVDGLDAGADDYLTKPFDRSELLARLRVGIRVLELQSALHARVTELEHALDEIHVLKGLVPICAGCKRIRNDDGYWQEVETYIANRSEVEFSHGMCPDCLAKYYPEISS